MNDVFISAKNVKRCFPTSSGDFWALKGVTADIPRGKLTILKGRSGSGKTTLLNLLSALDKPTEGEILFDGRDLIAMNENKRALLRRTEIGFVFQSVALIPMMTARENVEYALRMARCKGNRTQRAAECLKMVGLAARMEHMPQELSGGEQQRVAIARALVNSPRLIIADEPTGNLDPAKSLELMLLLQKINELGTTVLVVTHEKELVNAFAKRVISIEAGSIVSDGMDGYYAYEA